jgi:Na+/melibiose symporter-like transporter
LGNLIYWKPIFWVGHKLLKVIYKKPILLMFGAICEHDVTMTKAFYICKNNRFLITLSLIRTSINLKWSLHSHVSFFLDFHGNREEGLVNCRFFFTLEFLCCCLLFCHLFFKLIDWLRKFLLTLFACIWCYWIWELLFVFLPYNSLKISHLICGTHTGVGHPMADF